MALSAQEIEKCNTFASLVDTNGDVCATYSVIRRTDSKEASIYLENNESGGTAVEDRIKKLQEEYAEKKYNYMNPYATAKIINGVWWPAVAGQQSAMVDHPSDPALNSMRGIPISWIFKNGFIVKESVYNNLFPGVDKSKKSNVVEKTAAAFWDAITQINDGEPSSGLSEADQKQCLSLLFKSENAAKLYWLSFGGRYRVGHPINTLRYYNPYLGFLSMSIAFKAGEDALNSHGVASAVNKILKGFYNEEPAVDREALGTELMTQSDKVANAVKITNAALGAQYKWLQQQKDNAKTKDYYNEWFSQFFSTPKSDVNMCVIINELVNVDAGKTFTHSLECRNKLQNLALGYTKLFSIELAD